MKLFTGNKQLTDGSAGVVSGENFYLNSTLYNKEK